MSQNILRFDLIAVGDSTIDTFIKIHDASIECDINKKDCRICVPYGSKVPVDSIDYGVAGNAANVVMGTQKLGMASAIYTNVGGDDQGNRIKEAFAKSGVASDFVVTNPKQKSNLSVVLTFQGERTIFVYHQNWYYELPKLPPCSWMYLTSMAETFTNTSIMDDICHYLDRTHAKLVFGPGTYQLKANIKRYPRILEKCELLVLNMEEARHILEISNKTEVAIRDLLSKLLMLGPKMVVVTEGAEGSYASDGQQFLKVGVIPSHVTEKTGAGDAYSAGLIAALFKGEGLGEAMVWGTLNASSVISRSTTQSGQLSLEEIIKLRKKLTGFEAGSM